MDYEENNSWTWLAPQSVSSEEERERLRREEYNLRLLDARKKLLEKIQETEKEMTNAQTLIGKYIRNSHPEFWGKGGVTTPREGVDYFDSEKSMRGHHFRNSWEIFGGEIDWSLGYHKARKYTVEEIRERVYGNYNKYILKYLIVTQDDVAMLKNNLCKKLSELRERLEKLQ